MVGFAVKFTLVIQVVGLILLEKKKKTCSARFIIIKRGLGYLRRKIASVLFSKCGTIIHQMMFQRVLQQRRQKVLENVLENVASQLNCGN